MWMNTDHYRITTSYIPGHKSIHHINILYSRIYNTIGRHWCFRPISTVRKTHFSVWKDSWTQHSSVYQLCRSHVQQTVTLSQLLFIKPKIPLGQTWSKSWSKSKVKKINRVNSCWVHPAYSTCTHVVLTNLETWLQGSMRTYLEVSLAYSVK